MKRYKQRRSKHKKVFYLPEQNGHSVAVHYFGPKEWDDVKDVTSLTDLKNYMQEGELVQLHWRGGPGLPFANGITQIINTRETHLFSIDYRGTGASKPYNCTNDNTVLDIVNDAERLLDNLDISSCSMTGDCFGTVVATKCAAQFLGRVNSLGLYLPYTMPQVDDLWMFHDVKGQFPFLEKEWEKFVEAVPENIAYKGEDFDYIAVAQFYHEKIKQGSEKETNLYHKFTTTVTDCLGSQITDNTINQMIMETHHMVNMYGCDKKGLIPEMKILEDNKIPVYIVANKAEKSFHPESIKLWHQNVPSATFKMLNTKDHRLMGENNVETTMAMMNSVSKVFQESMIYS